MDKPTFMGYPKRKGKADVLIAGFPTDDGNTVSKGAAYGPSQIRQSSYLRGGQASVVHGLIPFPKEIKVSDIGDFTNDPDPGPIADVLALHKSRSGRVPMLLSMGGDHSITFPILEAMSETYQLPITVVHFDAHADIWDEVGGKRYTHASPFIRAAETTALRQLWSLGLRGSGPHASNAEYVDGLIDYHPVHMEALRSVKQQEKVMGEVLASIRRHDILYVSIDVDAMDPAFCPGTSTPEPGGFNVADLLAMTRPLFEHERFVGMDIVETNPTMEEVPSKTADVAFRFVLSAVACREYARSLGIRGVR